MIVLMTSSTITKCMLTKASTSGSSLRKGLPSRCWCWTNAAISLLNDVELLLLLEVLSD